MKTAYAQAVVAAINDGMSINDTLVGLKRTLERKHHEKLYASVLLEVVRTLESKQGGNHAVVTVAKASDATALKVAIAEALQELGAATETVVTEVVDETLIGGFVATYDYNEYDRSYKKALKSLYESIVT
jgi:F0F1-type ATP synthase delta subunit